MAKKITAWNEVFAIPKEEGEYYLYAPLARCVAVVNESAVSAVARYLERGHSGISPSEAGIISMLTEHGLLGNERLSAPVFPGIFAFQPHEATLFPTSRCNLRCSYCYADAGRKSVDMNWDVARAAIDFIATNAGLLGSPDFALGFHGGGEPAMAWELIVQSVEYAKHKAEEMGLNVQIFAATNGLLSQEQREYIAGNFTTLNVSLDGPEDIQNHNRPIAGGGKSYGFVRESLKYFDSKKFKYGIRSTITASTVNRMEEIVEEISTVFRPMFLHLEPVWICGRCHTSGEQPPGENDFICNFLKARETGRKLGVNVTYSGARLDALISKFCAAPGDGFNVLPEGIVTSCYEVLEPTDPRAGEFHYGRYDPANRSFEFDSARIGSLQKLSVENIPFCRDCYCKWHCAGDCLAKVFDQSGCAVHKGSPRCKLNRALILAQIEQLVHSSQPDNDSGTH